MTRRHRQFLLLVASAVLAAAVLVIGFRVLHEPLGIALWSIVAAIVLLPLAYTDEGLRSERYIAACASMFFGILFVGAQPAIILAAVAWSLLGGVQLLVAIRLPAALAIAVTMLGAALSLTWPIWMAGILSTHDLGPWVQRMVDLSPAFALNAAIAPEDPLTHRPLAYRLMNLGQDVDYAMPRSIWPCVMLHAGVGVFGAIATAGVQRLRRTSTRLVTALK